MIGNYYTLRHIALHLDQRLKGSLLSEAFSQNKNELILRLSSPRPTPTSEPDCCVIVSCEPSQNFVYLADSYARAKRNSVDVLNHAVGRSLQAVSIDAEDRQIIFQMEPDLRVIIQMFGSKANVIVVDREDKILESFLRSREMIGTTLSGRLAQRPPADLHTFTQQLRELGELSMGVALKKFFPRFGTSLLDELLFRSGLSRSETADRVSEEEIGRVFENAGTILHELESKPRAIIYSEEGNPKVFSIIELHHLNETQRKDFDAISAGIRAFIYGSRNADRADSEQTHIRQTLVKQLEKVSRTLEKIGEELNVADRAGHYEMTGELLKSHLHELHKGMSEAILENENGELVEVPLDKNLTPAKNAERYFDKAKRSRTAIKEKESQNKKLLEERRGLEQLLKALDRVTSPEEFAIFVEDQRESLAALGLVKPSPSAKSTTAVVPFRVFKVSGDFVVWAGKSGENNDLLSTRYTKSNDLWFHARSVGGSHVVLKSGTGKGEISKHAIREAASIAAYYSKMKNSRLVPVSVCQGKYVRKPKGAPAGTVTIDREEVVFVEPRLPGE